MRKKIKKFKFLGGIYYLCFQRNPAISQCRDKPFGMFDSVSPIGLISPLSRTNHIGCDTIDFRDNRHQSDSTRCRDVPTFDRFRIRQRLEDAFKGIILLGHPMSLSKTLQ